MAYTDEQKVLFGTHVLSEEDEDQWDNACQRMEDEGTEVTQDVFITNFLEKYFPEDVGSKEEIEFSCATINKDQHHNSMDLPFKTNSLRCFTMLCEIIQTQHTHITLNFVINFTTNILPSEISSSPSYTINILNCFSGNC